MNRVALVLAVAMGFVLGVVLAPGAAAPFHPSPAPAKLGYPIPHLKVALSYNPGCHTAGLVPSGCIFGLSNLSFVNEASYSYEYGLVPNSTPVGDYDYGTSNRQERVTLPGGSWDHYRVIAVVFVNGSGTAILLRGPNGGEFAFLHMDGGTVPARLGQPFALPSSPPVANDQQRLGDGELTSLAVQEALAKQPPRLTPGQSLRGGDFVGLSKWPLDPAFGLGVAGPANAHLCVVLDAAARAFFLRVAAGQDHEPIPTFKQKRWDAYRVRHKERRIAAYAGKTLIRIAAAWRWHQGLGGIKRVLVVKHSRRVKRAYREGKFEHGHITCWPSTKRCSIYGARGRLIDRR